MESKVCTKCKEDKSLGDYYKNRLCKFGVESKCSICKSKYAKQHYIENKSEISIRCKKYISNNKEKVSERLSKYEKNNKQKIAIRKKLYREKNIEKITKKQKLYKSKNKDIISIKNKIYASNNKEKIAKRICLWARKKRKDCPLQKVKDNLRARTYQAFKNKKWHKGGPTELLLGVSFEIARLHIEKQFTKGMTWNNNGKGQGKWNIDHSIPISSAKTEQEMEILCHYSNLKPMWSIENIKKSNKIIPTQMKMTI